MNLYSEEEKQSRLERTENKFKHLEKKFEEFQNFSQKRI